MKKTCRRWYIETYPTDALGQEIAPRLTFAQLLAALRRGEDAYKVIGVADSVIREALFSKLAELSGMTYNAIYSLWV